VWSSAKSKVLLLLTSGEGSASEFSHKMSSFTPLLLSKVLLSLLSGKGSGTNSDSEFPSLFIPPQLCIEYMWLRYVLKLTNVL